MWCFNGRINIALEWREAPIVGQATKYDIYYIVKFSELELAKNVTKDGKILLDVDHVDDVLDLANNGYIRTFSHILIRLSNLRGVATLRSLNIALGDLNVGFVVRPELYLRAVGTINNPEGVLFLELSKDDYLDLIPLTLNRLRNINLFIPNNPKREVVSITPSIPIGKVGNVMFSSVKTAMLFELLNKVFCSGGRVVCECSSPLECLLTCRNIDDLSVYVKVS